MFVISGRGYLAMPIRIELMTDTELQYGCKPLCKYSNLILEVDGDHMSCVECGLAFTEHDLFEKLHETWDKVKYLTLILYVAEYMGCGLAAVPNVYYSWIINRCLAGKDASQKVMCNIAKEINLKSGQRSCFNCALIVPADMGDRVYCMKYGTDFKDILDASRHVCKKWE